MLLLFKSFLFKHLEYILWVSTFSIHHLQWIVNYFIVLCFVKILHALCLHIPYIFRIINLTSLSPMQFNLVNKILISTEKLLAMIFTSLYVELNGRLNDEFFIFILLRQKLRRKIHHAIYMWMKILLLLCDLTSLWDAYHTEVCCRNIIWCNSSFSRSK